MLIFLGLSSAWKEQAVPELLFCKSTRKHQATVVVQDKRFTKAF
jgi:hypothetical protein